MFVLITVYTRYYYNRMKANPAPELAKPRIFTKQKLGVEEAHRTMVYIICRTNGYVLLANRDVVQFRSPYKFGLQ